MQLGAVHMVALSFAKTCAGSLLLWDVEQTQFSTVMKTSLGRITSWAVLAAQENGDVLLVSASGTTECQHSGGNLWLVKNTQPVQVCYSLPKL